MALIQSNTYGEKVKVCRVIAPLLPATGRDSNQSRISEKGYASQRDVHPYATPHQ